MTQVIYHRDLAFTNITFGRDSSNLELLTLEALRANWEAVKGQLVERIDSAYGVYVPTGRTLNPDSTLGAEILRAADDWGVDPYRLAEAVEEVWTEERAAVAEQREALTAARMATGLNARRIAGWEEAGRDYSTWPGLDVKARELASQYPALGIGRGFDEAGYDDTDYAGQLWGLLRQGARPARPKHDV